MCSYLFTALVSNLGVEKVQVVKFQKSEGKNINQPDFSYWYFIHNWNLSKHTLHFPNTPCPVDKCIHTYTHTKISRTLALGESLVPSLWNGEVTQFLVFAIWINWLVMNDLKKQFLLNGTELKEANFAQTLPSCNFISALTHINLNWLDTNLAELNLIWWEHLHVRAGRVQYV